MNCIKPDYASSFSCIQSRCKHNCCIGWEIDIDEETYQNYQTIPGAFGERLRSSTAIKDGVPTFCLGENERCLFLNQDNLCDIILHLGEDALCQICRDHPRFVNFFSDRQEWGLGLCCEAAAELIIKKKTPTQFLEDADVEWQEPEETVFFSTRDMIFELLQDRSKTIAERMQEIKERWQLQLPDWSFDRWADALSRLERLDSSWDNTLLTLKKVHTHTPERLQTEEWEIAWEQLLVYFVYRHLSESIYDGRFLERLAFSLISVTLLQGLCIAKKDATLDDLVELARQYSSEIEYSEENMEEMLTFLQQS